MGWDVAQYLGTGLQAQGPGFSPAGRVKGEEILPPGALILKYLFSSLLDLPLPIRNLTKIWRPCFLVYILHS